jgi:hypothetical protein
LKLLIFLLLSSLAVGQNINYKNLVIFSSDQSVLSQKMTKELFFIVHKKQQKENNEYLKKTTKQFKKQIKWLNRGNTKHELPPAPPELVRIALKLDVIWKNFEKNLQSFLKNGTSKENLEKINQASHKILETSNKLAEKFLEYALTNGPEKELYSQLHTIKKLEMLTQYVAKEAFINSMKTMKECQSLDTKNKIFQKKFSTNKNIKIKIKGLRSYLNLYCQLLDKVSSKKAKSDDFFQMDWYSRDLLKKYNELIQLMR